MRLYLYMVFFKLLVLNVFIIYNCTMTDYKKLTDTDEFRIAKPFMAIAGGNAVFFLLFFAITPLFVKMGITPYGEFHQTYSVGKTMEESMALKAQNEEAFMAAKARADWFINVMVAPILALVLGIVAGTIMGGSRGLFGTNFGAGLIAFISMLPPVMQLIIMSLGDPNLTVYVFIIVFSAVLGGMLGNRFVYSFFKAMGEDMERRR